MIANLKNIPFVFNAQRGPNISAVCTHQNADDNDKKRQRTTRVVTWNQQYNKCWKMSTRISANWVLFAPTDLEMRFNRNKKAMQLTTKATKKFKTF